VHVLGNMAPAKKSIESGFEDKTVRVLTHVSPESVTCGVTVAKFGVLGFLWNDCIPPFSSYSVGGIGSPGSEEEFLRVLRSRPWDHSQTIGLQHCRCPFSDGGLIDGQ